MAVEDAVKVSVEVPAPVIEVGLKAAVTPVGVPLAVSVTGELKPLVMASVTVEVPVLPSVTEAAVALNEKLGVAAELTVSVRVVVSAVPLAGVPVTATV